MTALGGGLTNLFKLQIEVHKRNRDPLNPQRKCEVNTVHSTLIFTNKCVRTLTLAKNKLTSEGHLMMGYAWP
jgi:uncharacterized protein YvpB